MAELLQLAICLFRMAVTISNKQTPCTHEASDSQFN